MSLVFNELTVRYGNATCPAVLDKISAEFSGGQLYALVGPNGTGKSSLLKALAGLQAHTGQVWLDRNILNQAQKLQAVAYMPQDNSSVTSLSVFEVILLGRLSSLALRIEPSLMATAAAVLNQFGLNHLADKTLAELSGGQRQMVFLAQALFRDPAVLLLDEPTAALDLRHQLLVLEKIQNFCYQTDHPARIVLMAVHDLNLAARYADQIVCLEGGEIVAQGLPQQVLTPERIKTLYGVEAEITYSANGHLMITPLRAA